MIVMGMVNLVGKSPEVHGWSPKLQGVGRGAPHQWLHQPRPCFCAQAESNWWWWP